LLNEIDRIIGRVIVGVNIANNGEEATPQEITCSEIGLDTQKGPFKNDNFLVSAQSSSAI